MHPSIVLLLMSLSSLQKENRKDISNISVSQLSKEERLAKLATHSGALLSIYLGSRSKVNISARKGNAL